MIGLEDRAGGDVVFGLAPGRLTRLGQVILDRWDDQKPAGQTDLAGGTNEIQVVFERLPPAPAVPGDRPASPGRQGAFDSFDGHLGFLDGPGGHCLRARGILGDDRFEHDKPEPGLGRFLDGGWAQRKLAGRLAPGIAKGKPRVRSGHIETVDFQEVAIEVLGQAVAGKAVVIVLD